MKFVHSFHWKKQRVIRNEIADDIVEICILNSKKIKDKEWQDAYNAVSKIPPSGRTLKVVYKETFEEESKTIKIITAYWLD